jgi:hypothetical protein
MIAKTIWLVFGPWVRQDTSMIPMMIAGKLRRLHLRSDSCYEIW